MSGDRPNLENIRFAARQIEGAVLRTPFLPARRLSELTRAEIFVKYENLQATSSFKERGALVKMLSLSDEERQRGVVAMSAGNHAQAVAYNAQRMGTAATIVMPRLTPFVKIAATRAFGANVVLEGETLAQSEAVARRIVAETGSTFVHPYDDPFVICGQGTVGLEIVADCPDLNAVVVPVGGGGLISGIAVAVKEQIPEIEVIGVETELFPSVHGKLRGTEAQCGGNTLAEGIAVKNVGALPLEIIRESVDDIVLVREETIEAAIAAYLILQKTLAEGAGAASLAAVLADPDRFRGKRIGLVLAGGNIDPRLAASIMVRELTRNEQIVCFRVIISDMPGSLAEVAATIAAQGGNILDVRHHRMMLSVAAKSACLDVTVETHGRDHAVEIASALAGKGYSVERPEPAEQT